jgi:hypothetical protein
MKIDQLRTQIANLKKEYQAASQATFTEESKALFAAHPELLSFGWRQYTPYFNDGDTCTFSAHTDDPSVNGFSDYGDWDGDELPEDHPTNLHRQAKATVWNSKARHWNDANPAYSAKAAATVEAVKAFLKQFEDDVLMEMFGDHKKVIVTRDGTQVEEYEHD